jgi:hypothetical protein
MLKYIELVILSILLLNYFYYLCIIKYWNLLFPEREEKSLMISVL